MKIPLSTNRILDVFLIILAAPLILAYGLIHLWENVCSLSRDYKDRMYMRRLGLIDQRHVSDFIDWNMKYTEAREIEGAE